jgi:hypothetical protein
MNYDRFVSSLSDKISQRQINISIGMRCIIVYDFYLKQSIIKILYKMNKTHLVVINALIHTHLDMHYF